MDAATTAVALLQLAFVAAPTAAATQQRTAMLCLFAVLCSATHGVSLNWRAAVVSGAVVVVNGVDELILMVAVWVRWRAASTSC